MELSWDEYTILEKQVFKDYIADIKEEIDVGHISVERYRGGEDHEGIVQYDIAFGDEPAGFVIFFITKDTLLVEDIEISNDYQRKHIATDVIKLLINTYNIKQVIGYSRSVSTNFWNSLGANITNDYSDYPEDYLVPFIIKLCGE